MGRVLTVDQQAPDEGAVACVVDVLREGGVAVLPTDSVYGICCAATPGNPAHERIFDIKRRDRAQTLPWFIAEASDLARYFGTSASEMLDAMDEDMIIIEPENRGDILAAYVCDMVESGTAPLEYCTPVIRDIILSNRKHELLAALERDLLDEALDSKQFVIF